MISDSDTPRTGRPPQLSDTEKKQLVTALKAGALAQGYSTELARVAKLIEELTGIRYSESGVWRLAASPNRRDGVDFR